MAVGVHACTDITGFGFLGHASEMIEDTEVGMVIDSSQVPFFSEAREFAEIGFVPGGMGRNRDFRKHMVDMRSSIPEYLQNILYDPQTSGGLLIAVSKTKASRLLKALHDGNVPDAVIVGEVVSHPKNKIVVK